jgi:carbonic anhydrase/acetyltransferase-like protein (isoleucine patch superfamily)
MVYEFEGYIPVVDPSSFIHPQAVVTGNVIIGKNVYIGPGAAIRGDWGQIIIEDGCNVQENCTIHMFPGVTVYLRKNAHIGHGAIIHGADIGENCLVGMNAVVMDNVKLEEVSDEMINWKSEGTKIYQQLPAECYQTLKPCEPLNEVPANRKVQAKGYTTWKSED